MYVLLKQKVTWSLNVTPADHSSVHSQKLQNKLLTVSVNIYVHPLVNGIHEHLHTCPCL